jgi:hypothetical protein
LDPKVGCRDACQMINESMQSRKKGKKIMLYKEKEETFVFYVKKMQVIGHLFTLTQL